MFCQMWGVTDLSAGWEENVEALNWNGMGHYKTVGRGTGHIWLYVTVWVKSCFDAS